MLLHLKISNYAIIDHIEIHFGAKLNVITGETGAGKSILLGALNLILGSRADTSVLLDKKKKCIVEGEFDIKHLNLRPFFEKHELDYDDQTIIRREIGINNKSRAFINDSPVQLAVLKELTEKLIDIHSQHQALLINSPDFQMNILDGYCGLFTEVNEFRSNFKLFRQLTSELNSLVEQEKIAKRDQDYLQFQLEEIEILKLQGNEDAVIEEELLSLRNSDKIKGNLNQSLFLLDEDDNNIYQKLTELKQLISEIAPFHSTIKDFSTRLESALSDTLDLSREINSLLPTIEMDEERLAELTDRQDRINRLLNKHQTGSVIELLELSVNFRSQLKNIDSLDEKIVSVQKKLKSLEAILSKSGQAISGKRKKQVPLLEKRLVELLGEVGIKNPTIRFILEQPGNFFNNGLDTIQVLFSSNTGVIPAPISKVASGGELSRIMLCLKYILASATELATIIFDEIDMGISGEISIQVGALLEQMSRKHQIIAITHLPQTAARGNDHFMVIKSTSNNKTQTHISKLKSEYRILEIAKMIAGENPGETALQSAKEMVDKFS